MDEANKQRVLRRLQGVQMGAVICALGWALYGEPLYLMLNIIIALLAGIYYELRVRR